MASLHDSDSTAEWENATAIEPKTADVLYSLCSEILLQFQ